MTPHLFRRTLLAWGVLGSALGPLTTTAATAATRLKLFGPENYPPMLRLQQGRPTGLLLDRLRSAEALLPDRYDVELTTWVRALALARQGQGGLIGVSRTAERETWLDFSDPLWVDELRLLVRADSTLRYRSTADLTGLRVGIARGTTGGDAFDAAAASGAITVFRDQTLPQRIQALLAGRLDAVVLSGNRSLAAQLAGDPALAARRGELRLAEGALLRDPLHVGLPKQWQGTAPLARLNAALKRLPDRADLPD